MPGTHEDAMLMLELAQWGTSLGVDDAASVIMSDDFDPETAEASDANVRKILNFNETLATLVKNDLLNRDLVYDWLWVKGAWDRVGPAAIRAREKHSVPQMYENFEALAVGQGGGS
jgi:hypothetical protein